MPEITITTIDKDCKYIMLGCDGLWDISSQADIMGQIKGGGLRTLQDSVQKIVLKQCATDLLQYEGLGMDNISALCVEFT